MWQVAKKDAYQVLYSFESGTSGKTLPSEVTSLLPEDSKMYFEGDTINAIQPEKTEVEVSDGTWQFNGYDEENKLANATNADENKNITFTGTWEFKRNASVINLVPTINASDKTLTVGDEFDPLKDVTATDEEDGDIPLTIENVIKNEVDNTKVGVYEVTYKVTDSQGASSVKTIKVTVKAKDTPVVPSEPNKPNDLNKPVVPNTSVNDKTPKTGDSTNMTLWTLVLIASGIAFIGAYRKRRKTNR